MNSSLCHVEEIKDFCGNANFEDVALGINEAGNRRAARLDMRSGSEQELSGDEQQRLSPLTATGLYRAMKYRNYDKTASEDRRLIYIHNLDPYFIFALAATAPTHQVKILRDAIWKHVAHQTSVKLRKSSERYPLFHLEFHIPYFCFRTSPANPAQGGRTDLTKSPRKWTDLSFLRESTKELPQGPKGIHGIFEAHISFVIVGSDYKRWVGYAFQDTEWEDSSSDCEEIESQSDLISDAELQMNLPVWNPKEYFLMVLQTRMAQVAEEWMRLIRKVESSVKQKVRTHQA